MANKIISKVVSWFVGNESVKGYIAAAWAGYQALALNPQVQQAIHLPALTGMLDPSNVKGLFPAFLIWAGRDAIKKAGTVQPVK